MKELSSIVSGSNHNPLKSTSGGMSIVTDGRLANDEPLLAELVPLPSRELCKHVVAERCKQVPKVSRSIGAGMKWNKEGILAILNWRCLLKNGGCSRYWKTSAKAA
jgi:hypothetical protein